MQLFTTINGLAAPLLRPNIDTDVIIRIERLTTVTNDKLAPYAFEAIRYLADGSDDPEFLPGQPPFIGAPILLAGENFGCGSSRESAVWALQAMGIRCVIAPSFGTIFYSNCFQNGVLPITLPMAQLQQLEALALTHASFTVDLQRQVIEVNAVPMAFEIDPLRRSMLLEGLDEVGVTLFDDAQIRAWQLADQQQRPWVWQVVEPRPSCDPLHLVELPC
ncbi:MAG: 3-isopropylmalate dehydratase small subunit [Pseudomonas sp.]